MLTLTLKQYQLFFFQSIITILNYVEPLQKLSFC